MRLGGCDIRCSALFLAVVAAAWLTNNLAAFGAYMAALTLHEGSHAVMAAALGCRVYSLELMPYGCAAKIADMQYSFDELMIALAGPLCSALAFMGCAALHIEGDFAEANLYIAAVNILPAYPLDGGRVARAALMAAGVRVSRWIERLAAALISAALLTAGIAAQNVTALIFAVFLFTSALGKGARAQPATELLRQREAVSAGRGIAVRHVALSADTTLGNALMTAAGGSYAVVCVLDDDMRRIGELDMAALYEAAARLGSNAKIRDALH